MSVQHYHDTYEIYLQLSGKRYLFYDNTCYTLERGDLRLTKVHSNHREHLEKIKFTVREYAELEGLAEDEVKDQEDFRGDIGLAPAKTAKTLKNPKY